MNKLEIVTEIAKGYNNLNSAIFEVLASDYICYESQWVLNSIYGKAETFSYLKQKFETIKQSNTNDNSLKKYYDCSKKRKINQAFQKIDILFISN